MKEACRIDPCRMGPCYGILMSRRWSVPPAICAAISAQPPRGLGEERERDSYRRDRPSGIGARKSSVFLAIGSSIDGADDALARFIPPSWETTQRHNINSSSAERTAAKTRRSSRSPNTQGQMTSQNVWSRHSRHFVGITWHNVWS